MVRKIRAEAYEIANVGISNSIPCAVFYVSK